MHFRRAGLSCITLFIAALVLTLSATLVSPPTSTNAQTTTPVRIMPLGDSITTHIPPYNSYRRPLWHMLANAGYSVDFVGSRRVDDSNRLPPNPDFDLEYEGHPGWRVDNILGSIRGWADAYDPDIVLVHLGTNDLIQGQSVDTTISELGQLIDTLRASNPNVTILMAQIIPFNRTHSQHVPTLNSRIASLVSSRNTSQSRVILVDQYSGFNTTTDTFDGTHPNVAGEQKLANRWYQALQGVLGGSGTQPTSTPTQIPANTAVPTQSATTVPSGSGTGLTGQYYNNIDLSNLVLTRTDPTINFYWGTGSPASSVAADTYSVRWTGQVVPRYSQTYTFYTTSDDGVRLRVNGQLLVDNWTNHGPTENSGTIALQAGQRYNIQLDYYESDVGATLTLSWSSQSQSKQIIPQSQLFPASGPSSTPVPTQTSMPTAVPTTASTGLYRAINLAGAAVTIDGQAWEAQASAANFSATVSGTYCWANPMLIPTTDINRFNMLRCSVYGGQMNLTLGAVPNGSYDVYLYIWEDNASVTTSISVEGALVQSNYQTGAAGTWRRLGPWPVQISDGTITVTTSGSWVNLSGLEVRYAG